VGVASNGIVGDATEEVKSAVFTVFVAYPDTTLVRESVIEGVVMGETYPVNVYTLPDKTPLGVPEKEKYVNIEQEVVLVTTNDQETGYVDPLYEL
jgi:hypothetical protein